MNSPSVNGVNSSREKESAVLLLLSGRAGVEETSGPERGVTGGTVFRTGDSSGAEAADSVEMEGSAGNTDSAETAAPVGMVDSVETVDSCGTADEEGITALTGFSG